jgi:YD repeat-containing protein
VLTHHPLYQYLPLAAKAESYAANGLNQYTTVVKNGTPYALSYDANGTLTSDGVWSYTFDAENRLLTASNGSTTASYVYDPLGRRVKKTVNGTGPFQRGGVRTYA